MDEPRARFDTAALFAALDAQRDERGLTWTEVAREMWAQSAVLNERRDDHPIAAATLSGMLTRRGTSCQHALFMLRWLDASPEAFLRGPSSAPVTPLPPAGPDRRLRWSLHATERRPAPGLYEAMNERRGEAGLTWPQLGVLLRNTPNQLTGMRTARFAVGMSLAMAVTQWLARPAADFVYAARW